jgi:hypothetical protein
VLDMQCCICQAAACSTTNIVGRMPLDSAGPAGCQQALSGTGATEMSDAPYAHSLRCCLMKWKHMSPHELRAGVCLAIESGLLWRPC